MEPVSKLSVVNQALIEIGRPTVNALDDTAASTLMSAKVDLLLPLLLQSSTWNFAIKFVTDNTPITSQFSPDFLYSYQLPADFGRFFKFATNTFPLYYEFLDGLLLSNTKPMQYYYVINTINYDVLTAMFWRALSVYVASDSCLVLTNNEKLTEYLRKKYDEEKSNAILLNDMERMIVSTPYNEFNRQTYI